MYKLHIWGKKKHFLPFIYGLVHNYHPKLQNQKLMF